MGTAALTATPTLAKAARMPTLHQSRESGHRSARAPGAAAADDGCGAHTVPVGELLTAYVVGD
jgi:hypothetical protein